MPFWCYMHMLLFEKKRPFDHLRVPNQIWWSNPYSWRQSICPLRFQSPIIKDTKKGAQKWHDGTKQLIKQLREQRYRTMT